jgi:hypothetical protein
MKIYSIGDRLICNQDVSSTFFGGTNPVITIPKGFVMIVDDAKHYLEDIEDGEASAWYYLKGDVTEELKELNPQAEFLDTWFGIDTWNDEDTKHIDKFFAIIPR